MKKINEWHKNNPGIAWLIPLLISLISVAGIYYFNLININSNAIVTPKEYDNSRTENEKLLPIDSELIMLKSGSFWSTPDNFGSLLALEISETSVLIEVTDKTRKNQEMNISIGVEFNIYGSTREFRMKLVKLLYNTAIFQVVN